MYSGKAKHSNRSCYANLQLSRTIKTIINLHSMTCYYAQLHHCIGAVAEDSFCIHLPLKWNEQAITTLHFCFIKFHVTKYWIFCKINPAQKRHNNIKVKKFLLDKIIHCLCLKIVKKSSAKYDVLKDCMLYINTR